MNKIILTGYKGFLGKEILKIQNVDCLYGDIKEKSTIEKISKNYNLLIHAAGRKKTCLDKKEIIKTNFRASVEIIKWCQKQKIKKLNFISTIETLYKKQNLYSKTKKMVDDYIKKYTDYTSIIMPSIIGSEPTIFDYWHNLAINKNNIKLYYYKNKPKEIYVIKKEEAAKAAIVGYTNNILKLNLEELANIFAEIFKIKIEKENRLIPFENELNINMPYNLIEFQELKNMIISKELLCQTQKAH